MRLLKVKENSIEQNLAYMIGLNIFLLFSMMAIVVFIFAIMGSNGFLLFVTLAMFGLGIGLGMIVYKSNMPRDKSKQVLGVPPPPQPLQPQEIQDTGTLKPVTQDTPQNEKENTIKERNTLL